ncbi:MAG TPA: hypothetical protein VK348_01870 [Planctomycetota bacterium]|nr:hypothetical protein [Planctomycetota bacterium]
MKRTPSLITAGLFLLGASCHHTSNTSSTSSSSSAQAAMNARCPMSGEELDAQSPTEAYKGQNVGFCCTKCMAKWDALPDADKKAKLDDAGKAK